MKGCLVALPSLVLLAAQAPAEELPAVLAQMETAWIARDVDGWLSAWEFATPEARSDEERWARDHFAEEETRLQLERPAPVAVVANRVTVPIEVFAATEPRGRVEQHHLVLAQRGSGWAVMQRIEVGGIGGLLHLSLDPQGFRADGLTLSLGDFALSLRRGTLFLSPQSVGPTAMVFVGEAEVKFRPGPETEREQLRQFCGQPVLVEKVKAAFVRIHPADLHRVLAPVRLEPDPAAAGRLGEAQRLWREHADRSFLLDASLPRSPWWVLPQPGDATVSFETAHHGILTYSLAGSEFESVSLYDRERKRQICLYAAGGGTRYDEDSGRAADVLHHDLTVRFEPRSYRLLAVDTLRIRLLQPAATLRMRLDGALTVHSVSSRVGSHLFFRVRGQNGIMVSLGALAGTPGEVSLTVRYSGVLRPEPVEHEVVQGPPPVTIEDAVPMEEVLVYTNRAYWYPSSGPDDHATAVLRLDVPAEFLAVSGGEPGSGRSEGGRRFVEYRQDRPAKYLTVAIGRLSLVGERGASDGETRLRAFGLGRTKPQAQRSLDRAAAILGFYASEFGPCPYPTINLVHVEGIAPGGHSPPGMVVVAHRPLLMRGVLRDDPTNFSDVPDFFLAHELAHQWWGQGVAGQNYHERWLSEGLAQYAAALWVRRSQGEDAYHRLLQRMAVWALRMTNEGPISLGYRLGHVKSDPQIFRAVVYDKGAWVLVMLGSLVGEPALRAALGAFQSAHRYGKAGTDDLREALERASDRDLRPYFDAWVFGTRLPELRYTSTTRPVASGYETTIAVKATGLPGPVPLGIAADGVARSVTLPTGGATFLIETPARPRRVTINDDRGLLARVARD